MKFLLISLIAGLLVSAPVWQLNFDQAKAEARQNHKFILLNFSGSDWCGPCIRLKKEVFESSDFQQVANTTLVLVRADFPRLAKNQLEARQIAHNEALAETYNRQGKFPFTVLLDDTGRVVQEWDGYPKSMTVASFIETIQKTTATK